MISKLKTYATAILGVLAAVAGFMWQITKTKSAKAAVKREKAARTTEKKVTTAIIEGAEKENEIKNDNTTDRSSFLD
jgi:hypothetical protein